MAPWSSLKEISHMNTGTVSKTMLGKLLICGVDRKWTFECKEYHLEQNWSEHYERRWNTYFHLKKSFFSAAMLPWQQGPEHTISLVTWPIWSKRWSGSLWPSWSKRYVFVMMASPTTMHTMLCHCVHLCWKLMSLCSLLRGRPSYGSLYQNRMQRLQSILWYNFHIFCVFFKTCWGEKGLTASGTSSSLFSFALLCVSLCVRVCVCVCVCMCVCAYMNECVVWSACQCVCIPLCVCGVCVCVSLKLQPLPQLLVTGTWIE